MNRSSSVRDSRVASFLDSGIGFHGFDAEMSK